MTMGKSLAQPQGIIVGGIPTQGRNLHIYSKKGYVRRPCHLKSRTGLLYQCLTVSCVSGPAVSTQQLQICYQYYHLLVPLSQVLYQVCHIFTSLSGCLTLGLMSQAGFSISPTLKNCMMPPSPSPFTSHSFANRILFKLFYPHSRRSILLHPHLINNIPLNAQNCSYYGNQKAVANCPPPSCCFGTLK